MSPGASAKLVVAALTMAIDRVTLEVMTALADEGIDALLFKGPVLGDWLYGPDEPRAYGDSDVLVAPGDVEHARATLRRLGFRPAAEPGEAVVGKPDLHAWQRAGRWVDLQFELSGLAAPGAVQWVALWAGRERWTVAGATVSTFGPAGRTLLLATHAAHHGAKTPRPLEDLRRGLQQLPEELWLHAWELADELDGTEAFAAGLGLLPEGVALRARLGFDDIEIARRVRLRASGASHVTLSFDDFVQTPGLRPRLRIVRHEIAPSADFLRWWLPLARRGRRGLLAARLWRPVWLAGRLPRALWAWGRSAPPVRNRSQHLG